MNGRVPAIESMKGALTLFAQDAATRLILYTARIAAAARSYWTKRATSLGGSESTFTIRGTTLPSSRDPRICHHRAQLRQDDAPRHRQGERAREAIRGANWQKRRHLRYTTWPGGVGQELDGERVNFQALPTLHCHPFLGTDEGIS